MPEPVQKSLAWLRPVLSVVGSRHDSEILLR
jgi:hypothetical protein